MNITHISSYADIIFIYFEELHRIPGKFRLEGTLESLKHNLPKPDLAVRWDHIT